MCKPYQNLSKCYSCHENTYVSGCFGVWHLQRSSKSNSVIRLISVSCDSQNLLLAVLVSLLPSVILKASNSIRLFFRVILLYSNFLIFLINNFLSMRRFFIVPEGGYKAKKASVVFFVLKEIYLPAGSVIICSIRGAVGAVLKHHKFMSFLARL